MSNWITDRLPTGEDALDTHVLIWLNYEVHTWTYYTVAKGTPWQPIPRPTPYVKPAWVPEWCKYECCWILFQRPGHGRVRLHNLTEENAEEAQQIANIYNKVYYHE
jgi:hypothetical protein